MSSADSPHASLHHRLVDSLYVEAMVMADEARAYFDRKSDNIQQGSDVMARLSFTCESLKVTTRLMHIIAWLLTQRAWQRGEISQEALADPKYRLGEAAATDPAVLAELPAHARALVTGSQELYARVMRLQMTGPGALQEDDGALEGPAKGLLDRLARAF